MRIGSSSQFWPTLRTSSGKMSKPPVRLTSIHGRIPLHPLSKSGEHCFRGDYYSFRLILRYSQLQHFTEFLPHTPDLISMSEKVGVAMSLAKMEYFLDMVGDVLAA